MLSSKKKWNYLLLLSGNEWAGNWFRVAQRHMGCLGGVSNKMYSRNQFIILSVPSLPLAGVTTRNSFIPLGSWNWETIQEILEVREPIAVFVFYCPRCKQAVGKVHTLDILIYSLMPGLFHRSWLNASHLTIFPWLQILLAKAEQALHAFWFENFATSRLLAKMGTKVFPRLKMRTQYENASKD